MKFSYNWITELVEGVDVDAVELSRLITMKTAESEGVEPFGPHPDSIIEIDNKSLTHRPDLWGHHGMAREVSAILRRPLKDPVKLDRLPEGLAPIQVSIEDYDLCPRYSALMFENVTVQPSPPWLQHRLEAIGLNPINNIVDVTNFVMAELAQPMHAFDADKLQGGTIFVRSAKPGERLTALNKESYELGPRNLVIADASGAVALAGIIGGFNSAIGTGTTRIVLESANFNAASVRKTSAALKLRTDASMRFEKSQDPVNTIRGLVRAIDLLREVSPGIRLAGGLADDGGPLPVAEPIRLPLDWLNGKLGRAVDAHEVRSILEALEFGVKEDSTGVFSVTVPTWRATKDISVKEDLVEEVGRMIGYGSITPQAPALPVKVPPGNYERAFHHSVRQMAAAQGFHEVYNYSFISEDAARAFGFTPSDHVEVANPIAAGQTLLRRSLLPGIWKNIRENSRFLESFRLFEIGREIHKQAEGLPREVTHFAAAIFAKDDGAASLFELKRLAECIEPRAEVRPATPRAFEHPARAAELYVEDEFAGRLFEFHPSMIENGRAAMLDLDLDKLFSLHSDERRFRPIRRFPSSAFDLSVIAGKRELAGDLRQKLASFAGPSFEGIEYVRQYAGPPLPEDKKSVSYRLTVAALDRTLSSEEVGEIRAVIIDGMRSLGYDLRV